MWFYTAPRNLTYSALAQSYLADENIYYTKAFGVKLGQLLRLLWRKLDICAF